MAHKKTLDYTPYKQFADTFGVSFRDWDTLVTAFTHRSYLNENNGFGLPHNERLEFLGDAVLELVVTDFLYHKFPKRPEGELTAFRSALVNTKSISHAGTELGMNDLLLLSKGESRDAGKARQYILANTYEAVIGALYVDQGYETAREFIETTLLPQTDEIVRLSLWRDAKSFVQEKAQEVHGVTPSYTVLKENGPDHDKNFTVGVFFGEKSIAQGRGKSKQEAEQAAARKALEDCGWV